MNLTREERARIIAGSVRALKRSEQPDCKKGDVLVAVDLDAVRDKIAGTIERAKAEDPRELRCRIAALEREQRKAKSAEQVEVEKIVEVPIIGAAAIEDCLIAVGHIQGAADALEKNLNATLDEVKKAKATKGRREAKSRPAGRLLGRQTARAPTSRPVAESPREPAISSNGDEPQLVKGARKILEALASHHPMRVTTAQLGTLSGYTASGGTFQKYLGILKRNDLAEIQGGDVRAADALYIE